MARARKEKSIINTKKPVNGIAVGSCSVCEELRLTFGDHRRGGVRFCQECLKHTFGWFQMTGEQKALVEQRFAEAMDVPGIRQILEKMDGVPESFKKSYAIGEARLRVLDANLQESRG